MVLAVSDCRPTNKTDVESRKMAVSTTEVPVFISMDVPLEAIHPRWSQEPSEAVHDFLGEWHPVSMHMGTKGSSELRPPYLVGFECEEFPLREKPVTDRANQFMLDHF